MHKIDLVVAGLILAGAGTWAASSFPANAGEPEKAMADSCCAGRDGVIGKVSCPYLPQPYALFCVHARASVKEDRGVVSYPSRVPGHTIPGVLRAIRLTREFNFPYPDRPHGDPVRVVGKSEAEARKR
jgi:hypothetical protein